MTNKPIMIDGVDVSKCFELGETISGITCGNGTKIRLADRYIYKYKLCKDNPNCLFKQLIRKTQECEELKKECNEYFELMAIRTEILAKNKEIFNKIEQLKTSKEQAEQKLNKMREYCKYITVFNNANKTNKGLDVEEVIQIIDEVE